MTHLYEVVFPFSNRSVKGQIHDISGPRMLRNPTHFFLAKVKGPVEIMGPFQFCSSIGLLAGLWTQFPGSRTIQYLFAQGFQGGLETHPEYDQDEQASGHQEQTGHVPFDECAGDRL
jgi:hypothetical protein